MIKYVRLAVQLDVTLSRLCTNSSLNILIGALSNSFELYVLKLKILIILKEFALLWNTCKIFTK